MLKSFVYIVKWHTTATQKFDIFLQTNSCPQCFQSSWEKVEVLYFCFDFKTWLQYLNLLLKVVLLWITIFKRNIFITHWQFMIFKIQILCISMLTKHYNLLIVKYKIYTMLALDSNFCPVITNLLKISTDHIINLKTKASSYSNNQFRITKTVWNVRYRKTRLKCQCLQHQHLIGQQQEIIFLYNIHLNQVLQNL